LKIFKKDEEQESKRKIYAFRFWLKILRGGGNSLMTFPEKVTDLRAKRRLLEINKHELIKDMAID